MGNLRQIKSGSFAEHAECQARKTHWHRRRHTRKEISRSNIGL
jgi:hypothetical protein